MKHADGRTKFTRLLAGVALACALLPCAREPAAESVELRPSLTEQRSAPAAARDRALLGTWSGTETAPGSPPLNVQLRFTRRGSGLAGTLHQGTDDLPLFEIAASDTRVSWTLVKPGAPYATLHFRGTLAEGALILTSRDGGVVTRLRLRRARAEEAAKTPPPKPAIAARAAPLPKPLPPPDESEAGNAPLLLGDLPRDDLAKTPPMGWASAGALGTDIEEADIREAAEGLDETGLRAAGYTYVELDDGWQGARGRDGVLRPGAKFPRMKALADAVHAHGLKFIIATAAGPKSCAGFTGSYGHEAADARLFAAWGVDGVMFDLCGADGVYKNPAELHAGVRKMAAALRATGRDILFALAADDASTVRAWAAQAGADVVRSTHEGADGDVSDSSDPKANAWNDPGLLPADASAEEYRMRMNLRAVRGSPLMLGNDVRIMMRDMVTLLANRDVIAVDQDALGRAGKRVVQNDGTEAWARPLSGGAMALGFFNRGDAPRRVDVSWKALGISGVYRVRDLWWHQDIGKAKDLYSVYLLPHTSVMVRLDR
jgi:hypothetical protein